MATSVISFRDHVVDPHAPRSDLGPLPGFRRRPTHPQARSTPGAEEEANRPCRGVVLAQIVALNRSDELSPRPAPRISQRTGEVGHPAGQQVLGDKSRRCLQAPRCGSRTVYWTVSPGSEGTGRIGEIGDRLGCLDHRRVEVGGEGDRLRQVLIARRLQRDLCTSRAVAENPVDPNQLGVEPELVDVIRRLGSERTSVVEIPLLKKLFGGVDRIGQRPAVERRAVPAEPEIPFVRDETEPRPDRAGLSGV